jgi:poly-gamma-glutamate system protein
MASNVLKLLALFAGLVIAASPASAQVSPQLRETMLTAARTMEAASDIVLAAKLRMGIWVGAEADPNETGLIGPEYTDMTTSQATLSNKRTPTNPDFAAALVRRLSEFGLREGDTVLVVMSGSFLAADLSTLAALEALKANTVLITSIGSSMWGANNAEFNIVDILALLHQRGVIATTPLLTVLGGSGGSARNMEPAAREMLRIAALDHGVPLVEHPTVPAMVAEVARRVEAATGGNQALKLLIKVGGSVLSVGGCPENYDFATGMVPRPTLCSGANPGLFQTMKAPEGLLVLHMLDMKKMAMELGVPYDPMPLPIPGENKALYGG